MSLRRFVMIACMLTIGVPRSTYGQRPSDAMLGARVRLETASGRLVTGTIVGVEADTIRLVSQATAPGIAVPRATIVGYDVSGGRERGRGAKRGTLVGGALGLAVLAASLVRDTATVDRPPSDVRGAVAFSAGIVAVGAVLGAAFAPERWESARGLFARARDWGAVCPGQCVALRYRF